MDVDTAQQLAEAVLARRVQRHGSRLALDYEGTKATPYGWLFPLNSRESVLTGDIHHELLGAPAILVTVDGRAIEVPARGAWCKATLEEIADEYYIPPVDSETNGS